MDIKIAVMVDIMDVDVIFVKICNIHITSPPYKLQPNKHTQNSSSVLCAGWQAAFGALAPPSETEDRSHTHTEIIIRQYQCDCQYILHQYP